MTCLEPARDAMEMESVVALSPAQDKHKVTSRAATCNNLQSADLMLLLSFLRKAFCLQKTAKRRNACVPTRKKCISSVQTASCTVCLHLSALYPPSSIRTEVHSRAPVHRDVRKQCLLTTRQCTPRWWRKPGVPGTQYLPREHTPTVTPHAACDQDAHTS